MQQKSRLIEKMRLDALTDGVFAERLIHARKKKPSLEVTLWQETCTAILLTQFYSLRKVFGQ